MANLLHKLLKNTSSSSLRSIATVKPYHLPKPSLSLTPQQAATKPVDEPNPDRIFNPIIEETTKSANFSRVYPSFSFGYLLNPGLAPGSGRALESDEEFVGSGDEDVATVYADSVKKKRKRKMNKHKYKKLRKRLRRKT